MLTNLVKWTVIPAVLIASLFSELAGTYEPWLNAAACLVAIILVQRSCWRQQYIWGAGFTAIAVMFGPFGLAVKVFLLLGLTTLAAFSALVAGFRMRPLPVVCPAP